MKSFLARRACARRVAEGTRKALIEESLASEVVSGPATFEGELRSANVAGEAVAISDAALGDQDQGNDPGVCEVELLVGNRARDRRRQRQA